MAGHQRHTPFLEKLDVVSDRLRTPEHLAGCSELSAKYDRVLGARVLLMTTQIERSKVRIESHPGEVYYFWRGHAEPINGTKFECNQTRICAYSSSSVS